jgi:hypothetical protein
MDERVADRNTVLRIEGAWIPQDEQGAGDIGPMRKTQMPAMKMVKCSELPFAPHLLQCCTS